MTIGVRAMKTRLLAFAAVLLAPVPAFACASCLFSAYGDRTFNWAMLGLILMPFVVTGGFAAGFWVRYARVRATAMVAAGARLTELAPAPSAAAGKETI